MDKERLQLLINETYILIQNRVTSETPEFVTWKTKVDAYLKRIFGEDSIEVRRFRQTSFDYIGLYNTSIEARIDRCKKGIERTRAVLTAYLEVVGDIEIASKAQNKNSEQFKKVFIVHGHDETLKQTVARIVEKQGIEAIILSEKVNQGKTIIEKIEDYSDVEAAICLFTNDDEGKEKDEKDIKPRARQNVVFETGYFIGYLGRDKVAILSDKENELPGDLSGIVYTETDDWKGKLCAELENMGFKIDFRKLYT